MCPWLLVSDGKITLKLHIRPGAKQTAVTGLHGEALKIRLAAAPIDGQAQRGFDRICCRSPRIAQVGGLPEKPGPRPRAARCLK